MSQEDRNVTDTSEPTVVDKVPSVPFKVISTGIPFYRDRECKRAVEDAQITILQALDPEDPVLEQELVPTTLTYKEGDYVTMNLDSKKLWEESWYRDPLTGKIEKAWEIHVNFVGDRISEASIEKERDRIADLERQIEERMTERSPTVQ
jgi:hypothetical protein